MNNEITNNKYVLLNLKPKYSWLIVCSILLFLLIIFSSIYYKTYDSFKVTGTYKNKQISINILSSDANNIINSDYLVINNKKYKFSIESVSQVEYDILTNASYQTIILTTSEEYYNNEILEITFYKKEQRIIEKFIDLIK